MKNITVLILICFATSSIAQTKLINHKSHSGTSKTFNPHSSEGNFGLPNHFFKEIKKNLKSKYKLIRKDYLSGEGMSEYILFIKSSTDSVNIDNHIGANDNLLARVELISKDSKEMADKIEELLIQKLEEYRKEEKP